MSKIDLGRKWGDDLKPVSISELKDETRYPCLHIDESDDPQIADIPDQGECTIKYKVRDRTHSERTVNGKKKKTCSLTLDVQSIEPPSGKYKKKNGDSDGGLRKNFEKYWKDEDKK